jgi:hypothetical protein
MLNEILATEAAPEGVSVFRIWAVMLHGEKEAAGVRSSQAGVMAEVGRGFVTSWWHVQRNANHGTTV